MSKRGFGSCSESRRPFSALNFQATDYAGATVVLKEWDATANQAVINQTTDIARHRAEVMAQLSELLHVSERVIALSGDAPETSGSIHFACEIDWEQIRQDAHQDCRRLDDPLQLSRLERTGLDSSLAHLGLPGLRTTEPSSPLLSPANRFGLRTRGLPSRN